VHDGNLLALLAVMKKETSSSESLRVVGNALQSRGSTA
jgi:hypothetical protein